MRERKGEPERKESGPVGLHGDCRRRSWQEVDPERQRKPGDSGSSAEEKEDGRVKTRENIDCPCESRGEFYMTFRKTECHINEELSA